MSSAGDESDYEEIPIKKKIKTDEQGEEEDKNEEDKSMPVENVEQNDGKEEEKEEKNLRNPLWDEIEENEQKKEDTVKPSEVRNTVFYNQKTGFEDFERRNLETIQLRNYHNWIKSVLINKYTNEIKKYYREHFQGPFKICVLDLGCGNGGDLTKWSPNGINYYVGVDVSKSSVQNAFDRWNRTSRNRFLADFVSVSGAAREENFFKNINDNVYFDIVSSQFVIHYMFSKESYVRNLFNNVSKRLLKNGYFICTIPDADVLVKRIRTKGIKNENGEIVLGNQHYSIKFKSDQFPKDKPYGIEYGFFLDDAAVGSKTVEADGTVKITYVPEYLIIPENFKKIAKEYDLELVEEKNFHEFCQESIKNRNHYFLMEKLKLEDIGAIPKSLWEISYLYKVCAFKKTSGMEMNESYRKFEELARGKVILQDEEEEEEPSPQNDEKKNEDALSDDLFGDDL